VAGTDHRGWEFRENRGNFGNRHFPFGRMVAVIQADADDFRRGCWRKYAEFGKLIYSCVNPILMIYLPIFDFSIENLIF